MSHDIDTNSLSLSKHVKSREQKRELHIKNWVQTRKMAPRIVIHSFKHNIPPKGHCVDPHQNNPIWTFRTGTKLTRYRCKPPLHKGTMYKGMNLAWSIRISIQKIINHPGKNFKKIQEYKWNTIQRLSTLFLHYKKGLSKIIADERENSAQHAINHMQEKGLGILRILF